MVKVKDISQNCLKLLLHFECSGKPENYLKAYKDQGGTWTIGAGTTRYPDGEKVKEADVISIEEAYEYLHHALTECILKADELTTDAIEQHQFDAIVDFIYNEGWPRYKTSTLRKLINDSYKNYAAIVREFAKWKYCDHKEDAGLVRRRKAESYMYVYGELKFNFLPNDNII